MEYRILGPLEVWAHGRRLSLRGPRPERVLAALLLDSGRVVSRGRLAEAVWDAEPPKTADRQVQNLVAMLRRLFIEAGAPADVIGTERAGYVIRIDRDQLDASRFACLVEAARRLRSADPDAAVTTYRSALDLWRGPALAGTSSRSIESEAARWDEMRLAAWEERYSCELDTGRHHEVVGELAALADQHPFRERLTQLLMLALYRCGRQTDSLAAYHGLRTRLAEEMGLDPSDESRRLHDAILRRDPSLDVAARVTTATPVLPVPAQLPADITAFTGRREHLRALDSLGGHLVAITGTAGVGKTALAVHWAHRVRDRFADGQLYVNLRGYGTDPPIRPVEALAGFLYAFGIPPERIPTDEDDATALYRSQVADKRVLVLLDNARHPDQIRPLLPGGSSCVVLVTARDEMVGLVAKDGAETLPLDVLSADEARALLAAMLGTERARTEPEATVELARRCANLPLALRIAAAHLRVNPRESVTGLCSRLAERPLAALDVSGDSQAAVRATIDLSYIAQPAPVQRVYRLLGLLPFGDVVVEAAGAVAGVAPAEAASALDRLAEAHLVERRTRDRFGFHDLLRRYAGDRAGTEESDAERAAAIGRFHDWYLHSVDAAARVLYPHLLRLPVSASVGVGFPPSTFDDDRQALAWLDAERPNLVAAVTHAANHGPCPAAWRLADAVRGYFYLRMHAVDWMVVAAAAEAAAAAEGDAQARASAQFSLAMLPWRQGRHDEAVRHYEAALAFSRAASWRAGETAALGSLGNVQRSAGRLSLAAGRFRQVIELDAQEGQTASAMGNLGLVCWELGQLTDALDHLTQALPRFRKIGSRSGEATVLANLGEVMHALGRSQEATDHLTVAATMHENVGHRPAVGDTSRCLAEVRCDTGDYGAALEQAEYAVRVALDSGHRRYEANARIALGTAYQALGDHSRAYEQHLAALAVARAAGERYAEVKALIGAALAGLAERRADAATHAHEALALARQTGYRMLEGLALTALAHLHLASADVDRARDYGREALDVHRSTGHQAALADTIRLLERAG
jgi:DNA-binding SARP family transcriptional activator/tetratricopeptide (TPR) repeat protein